MSDREIIKTSCPRDCYDGCGIAVVKRGGKITRVLGDPDHPVSRGALCGKCAIAYNGVWLDPEARLLHPMRRTGPKGSGSYERVSWDDAIGEIATRLSAIARKNGASSVLHTHYTGTCSAIANSFPERFFKCFGATEAIPDTICNNAGHAALDYVFGYTVANDVSARDLQTRDKQWVRAKGLDTFCPLGPYVVTRDEIPDPQKLRIVTTVDGVEKQRGSTADMIFSVQFLIAHLSRAFTLNPGDMILTGTPSGVGKAMNPPEFLGEGSVVSVEIEGIGKLTNRCRVL